MKKKKVKKMKMRSTALISGLLVLSAMVVFAGTASAVTSIQRTPDSIMIADGWIDTFTVTVLPSQDTNTGDVGVEMYSATGIEKFDIVIKDEEADEEANTLALGTGNTKVTASLISYTSGVPRVFSVEVTNNGAPVGQYGIKFAANDGTVIWGDDASIWAEVESGIPEFTTIAIPVASILGLLFFFNHRKHKKE